MNTYSLFEDFSAVSSFVLRNLRQIFTNFYENPRFNFLFNMALLPIILLFAFDVLMTFILSFSSKRLVFFNVFSAKSWSAFRAYGNQNRLKVDNYQIRYNAASRVSRSLLLKFKKRKASGVEGKVFKKDYVDWKEGLNKNITYQNQLLRTVINMLGNGKKNNFKDGKGDK